MRPILKVYAIIGISILIVILAIFIKPKIDTECYICDNETIQKIDFDFPVEKEFRPFNTSVIKNFNNTYTIYTRVSNRTACLESSDYFRKRVNTERKNFVIESILSSDFKILSSKYIDYGNNELSISDIRPFRHDNKLYFIGTYEYIDKYSYSFGPVIITDQGKIIKIYYKNSPGNDIKEKNWIPIIWKNNLVFIIHHNPFTLGKIDLETGETNIIYQKEKDENIPNLRGNTTYLHLENNKYIGITHTMKHHVIDRTYSHYFTLLNMDDQNPYIEKLSKSICFGGECGIEFVLGFEETLDRKKYFITYGKQDCSAHGFVIPKSDVFKQLENIVDK